MAVSGRREGEVLAEISNGLVSLHTKSFGKGPTHAKTYAINDMTLCVLYNCLTRMERTLVESGHEATVRRTRQSFYDATADSSRAVVEAATGRKVIAYVSQLHVDPDFIAETFLFEPAPGQDFVAEHEQGSDLGARDGQPE